MSFINELVARLRGAFRASRQDDELREELEAHLEMQIEDNIRRGMSPDEARRQALLSAGGMTYAAEAVRDQRGLPWAESIAADLRYAFRALRRAPAFTLVVVMTLALGIGANTAIFSVVRGVLLKPLPHRDGDRLVYLRQSADGPGQTNLNFSVPEVRDLRNGAPALTGLAEYSPWSSILQTKQGGAERITVGLVTGNYFEVMGLTTVVGRVTGKTDDGPGVPPVAVLTHDFWIKKFGGDPSIVGKQITLDRKSVTVIGVLQAAPFFPDAVDAMLNMVNSEHHLSAQMVEGRSHRMTEIVARFGTSATLEEVRSQVGATYARMQADHSDAYARTSHYKVEVIPFREAIGERARLTLLLLMGAAAFVLIIAVANVANLTLMRGVRREHELVVRAALGAGIGRLRRLLLAENLLLTLMGAVVGVAIALAGTKLLVSLAERYSPRANEIRLDGTVLAFMLGLSLLVAMLLSFLATLPREGGFAAWILAGAQRMSGGLRKHRLQRALVVVQVAVSVMLLAGAGLLTRTMIRLSDVNTGLRTEQLLTMNVPLVTPGELLANPASDFAAKQRYAQMRDEIGALPGVVSVGVGSPMPLRRSDVIFEVKAEGRQLAPGEAVPRAELRTAAPEFFDAAGIPITSGRAFAATDGPMSGKVVIINQVLADKFFPGEDAVGKRVAWTGDVLKFSPISGDWRTVIGVVSNTRDGGLDAEPRPVMYQPFAQFFSFGAGLVIRADSNVEGLKVAASRIVRQIAPTAPIENLLTITQYKERGLAPRKLNAALISSFGVLALLIATVGIAGVLAFSVSARTNEIGIRMSLGAGAGRVQRMILREGGVLVLLGLVLGIAGAWAAGGLIQGLLYGVAPHDPTTYATVALAMAAIGIGACWIPARRASRIDPVITMRAS